MLNAKLFATNEKYRNEMFTTLPEGLERNCLVVQFCANDPDYLLQAALLVQDACLAVDLNLGCPQHIAKRGNYGSFLQDDWPLISKMVSRLAENLLVPVTVKIRVFESVERTVEYGKMIQDSGASLLTVHGRLRSQKGTVTGLADWSKIAAVKQALSIPVVANGNILYYTDIAKCLEETRVDGVMSAEGHLYNPAIFYKNTNTNTNIDFDIDMHEANHTSRLQEKENETTYFASWFMAREYLDIVKDTMTRHGVEAATPNQAKAHFFKLFHALLPLYTDLRDELGRSCAKVLSNQQAWDELHAILDKIQNRVLVRLLFCICSARVYCLFTFKY